jgi:excisionase family DNA binding protein
MKNIEDAEVVASENSNNNELSDLGSEPLHLKMALLVGVADVAGMMSASERTVWRLSDAGKMPAPVRIGRLVRWSRQAILDWIEAGCPAVRAFNGRGVV